MRWPSTRVLAGAAAVAFLLGAQGPEPSIDAIFTDFSAEGTPGCAAGATRDGRTLFARGFGLADLEHRTALTAQSVFYMASVSKQFMALAILLLEQDGKLRLDDAVRRHVPELPEHAASITLRHLLQHTSGLRDYLTLTSLAGRPPDYVITEPIVLQTLSRQKRLNFEPGSEHLYSNSGYVLLSIVAQRVTGRRLDEWARERIFSPLGMQHTRFQHDHAAPIPGRANGYVRANEGWRVANSMLDVVGDGGMYSTVDDMLRWAAAFEATPFAPLLARMQTPGTLGDGRSLPNGYGMGLIRGTYRGLATVSHGGALVGYRTVLMRLPDHKLTVVTLCNNATANPTRLSQRIVDHYTGAAAAESAADGGNRPPPGDSTLPVPRELREAFAGAFYSAELDATYRLFSEGDQLRVEIGARPPVTLGLIGPDRLRMPSGAELIPTRDGTGAIVGFALNAGRVRNLAFARAEQTKTPSCVASDGWIRSQERSRVRASSRSLASASRRLSRPATSTAKGRSSISARQRSCRV